MNLRNLAGALLAAGLVSACHVERQALGEGPGQGPGTGHAGVGGGHAGHVGPGTGHPAVNACNNHVMCGGAHGGQGCSCHTGCCAMHCAGDTCQAKCDHMSSCTVAGEAAADYTVSCTKANCVVDADMGNNVEVTCKNGATCDIRCKDTSNCFVTCMGAESHCVLHCGARASNCSFKDCTASQVKMCGKSGVSVCNTPCP